MTMLQLLGSILENTPVKCKTHLTENALCFINWFCFGLYPAMLRYFSLFCAQGSLLMGIR